MAPTIQIRNLTLGEGRPKICIPLTDTEKNALRQTAKHLTLPENHCDLAEWRADFFTHLLTPEKDAGSEGLYAALSCINDTLGEIPLLFTIRTDAEGGAVHISTADYIAVNLRAIESGAIDLVDVELSRGDEAVAAIVTAAHKAGVAVIGSRHDFAKTPPKEEIVHYLCRMQELVCDIAKFAVMPQCERDVLTLLDATLTMKEEHAKTPVITMSMGKTGALSRVAGSLFGSCLTFGTAGKASAPGQLPADVLCEFLEVLK